MSGFGRGRGAPRGGGGGKFRKSDPNEPRISSEVQIFVEGLPLDAKLPELVNFFSAAGKIKSDRMTRNPRVWLYHDKATGRPTGECTITYCDHESQASALQMFDGQSYNGNSRLIVTPSIVKPHMARPTPPPPRGRGRGSSGGGKMMGRGSGGFDRREPYDSRGGFRRGSSGHSGGYGRDREDFGHSGGYGRDREDFGHSGGYERDQGENFGQYGREDSSYGHSNEDRRFGSSRFTPY